MARSPTEALAAWSQEVPVSELSFTYFHRLTRAPPDRRKWSGPPSKDSVANLPAGPSTKRPSGLDLLGVYPGPSHACPRLLGRFPGRNVSSIAHLATSLPPLCELRRSGWPGILSMLRSGTDLGLHRPSLSDPVRVRCSWPAELRWHILCLPILASCPLAQISFQLGYDPANPLLERQRIVTASGIEYAPRITVRSATAIGRKVTRLEVLCHDIPAESGVDGLLGLNFLRHFKLTLRPRKGVIELSKER